MRGTPPNLFKLAAVVIFHICTRSMQPEHSSPLFIRQYLLISSLAGHFFRPWLPLVARVTGDLWQIMRFHSNSVASGACKKHSIPFSKADSSKKGGDGHKKHARDFGEALAGFHC